MNNTPKTNKNIGILGKTFYRIITNKINLNLKYGSKLRKKINKKRLQNGLNKLKGLLIKTTTKFKKIYRTKNLVK